MMTWKEKRILFYLFNNARPVGKHNLQQLAMASAGSVDASNDLINDLLSEGYLVKEESKFKLSNRSEDLIEGVYLNIQDLMLNVKSILQENFDQIVEIIGGVTGLYFTYTEKLHMFRFHPEEHRGELILRVRLPNLLRETIDYKYNEFYLSQDTLNGTPILSEIVRAHINMIDKYHSGLVK